MAGVITTHVEYMADVIANVTDGIATWGVIFQIMADVVAIVADGLPHRVNYYFLLF